MASSIDIGAATEQLLGQHREIAALRGNGWGRKHATVDYVFRYSPYKLFQFHLLAMEEMVHRGYRLDYRWYDPLYSGQHYLPYESLSLVATTDPIYPEHDMADFKECVSNL